MIDDAMIGIGGFDDPLVVALWVMILTQTGRIPVSRLGLFHNNDPDIRS